MKGGVKVGKGIKRKLERCGMKDPERPKMKTRQGGSSPERALRQGGASDVTQVGEERQGREAGVEEVLSAE